MTGDIKYLVVEHREDYPRVRICTKKELVDALRAGDSGEFGGLEPCQGELHAYTYGIYDTNFKFVTPEELLEEA